MGHGLETDPGLGLGLETGPGTGLELELRCGPGPGLVEELRLGLEPRLGLGNERILVPTLGEDGGSSGDAGGGSCVADHPRV